MLKLLILGAVVAVTLSGSAVDWRIVAAEQKSRSVIIISGAPGAATNVLWRWTPEQDPKVKKEHYRAFNSIDECKVTDFGATILANASGGGIAAIDVKTTQCVWYAVAPLAKAGPHSVAMLPDGRVAVANSTGCDKLEIFDVRKYPLDPEKQPHNYAADIAGAHGVAWNSYRHSLFVLGYTNIYEYAYINEKMSVIELRRWRYDDKIGDAWGHDLVPDAQGGYFMTNHKGVWRFDPEKGTFKLIHEILNAKSFSRDSVRGDLMQVATIRYWSDRLVVIDPNGKRREVGPYPGAKFYKARWFKNPDARRLVWRDEFNGDKLDTRRWRRCPKASCDWARPMSNRPDLVQVKNGSLVMYGVANSDTNADPRPYITGGVQSDHRGLMRRGKVEMRVKLEDHQKGAWPALWMLGERPDDKGRGWPWSGEIDIVERLNGEPQVYHTIHSGWTHSKRHLIPKHGDKAPIKNGEWHVYGLAVKPDAVVWFVDGKETFRYSRYADACDPDHWPFGEDMFFLLDMQLGGRWVGPVDLTTLPVKMYVDWIRVYE